MSALKNRIQFAGLLLTLAIITEICICLGAVNHERYHRLDNHSPVMEVNYILHGPGEWAMYKLFPAIADMDDHITGSEGGLEDTAGTALFFIIPVLLLFLSYLFLIWVCVRVYRLLTKFSNRSPQSYLF